MGQQYSEINERVTRFIAAQPMFFVGTAAPDGRVNVSPKGMDSLRVLSSTRVVWLNVTGSGNETAAHVRLHSRMTLMFCAFAGDPMILRLYGRARAIHHNDEEWSALFGLFEPIPGARQIFDLTVELVQTSCGMAVPFLNYEGERDQLRTWAQKQGPDGLPEYWAAKNQLSIDGIATDILAKNVAKIS